MQKIDRVIIILVVQVSCVSAGAFSMSGVFNVFLQRATREISKFAVVFYVVSFFVSEHRIL